MKRSNQILGVMLSTAMTLQCANGIVLSIERKEDPIVIEQKNELTDQQMNSIAMLNYLAVFSEEITASSNSRLFLENAYSSLLSNTNPAVDSRTQEQLTDLLDTIESFRMIDVKRERLQYIYEKNKAEAIRAAVPDPLAVLNVVQSRSIQDLVLSGLYFVMDSASSYEAANSEAEMDFLEDGWALDDDEAEALHLCRKESFDYMLDIVRDHELPGNLALSEQAVKDFVSWKNTENVQSRIQFLESHQSTYEVFGDYWLLCAKSYYEAGNYEKCLGAINNYRNLDIHIFRRDTNYAQTLPYVVDSLIQLYQSGKVTRSKYIQDMNSALNQLKKNVSDDDWSLKYIGAQSYIQLYQDTKSQYFLQQAYDIALNNVNELIAEQKKLNKTYLKEVVQKEMDHPTKEEKKEIKQYNKMIKQVRKTELPPVSEPLKLNCDLLFALADKLDISEEEQNKLEKILHPDGEDLFLSKPIDALYRIDSTETYTPKIEMDHTSLKLPVQFLSDLSVVTVKVKNGKKETVYDDWKIDQVEREKEGKIETFQAICKSPQFSKRKWEQGDTVRVEILRQTDDPGSAIIQDYVVKDCKQFLFYKDVDLKEIKDE